MKNFLAYATLSVGAFIGIAALVTAGILGTAFLIMLFLGALAALTGFAPLALGYFWVTSGVSAVVLLRGFLK